MLAELRAKSQITIPKELVSNLGLSEGDQLEVFEKDGMICLMPVAVYPKGYVEALQAELAQVKEDLKAGKQPVFDDLDAMFDQLERDQ